MKFTPNTLVAGTESWDPVSSLSSVVVHEQQHAHTNDQGTELLVNSMIVAGTRVSVAHYQNPSIHYMLGQSKLCALTGFNKSGSYDMVIPACPTGPLPMFRLIATAHLARCSFSTTGYRE
jgi:hypothetical protein